MPLESTLRPVEFDSSKGLRLLNVGGGFRPQLRAQMAACCHSIPARQVSCAVDHTIKLRDFAAGSIRDAKGTTALANRPTDLSTVKPE